MKHSDLIEKLGGGTKLSEQLLEAPGGGPIARSAIYQWAKLDHIPWKWRPAVMAVARSHGVPLPEDFIPGVEAETMQ
jgi:hypothetical protein